MTNNQLTDERVTSVIERLEHYACNLKWTNVRGAQDLLAAADGLRELQERRKAAMDSEPFAYIIQDKYERERGVEGHLSRSHVSKYVSQEDINEHEITCIPLYRHAQPAPVVPDAYVRDEHGRMMLNGASEPKIGFGTGWNACRAAMLQAGYAVRDLSTPVDPQVAEYEQNVMHPGNYSVIGIDPASGPDRTVEVRYVAPPGYVMVPKEPAEAMINAWLSEVANWRGHVAGYKAMLAAAPQEVKGE